MKNLILALLMLTAVGLSAQRTVRYSLTSTGTIQAADLVATDDLTVTDDATINGDLTAYKHVLTTEFTSTAGAGFDTTTAVAYQINLINSAGDTVVVEAPTPVEGVWFTVVRSRTSSGKPVYINTTADNLMGAAANVTLSAALPAQRLVYVNSTVGWVPEN